MAYDGLFIKNQIKEFKSIILNENISRIYSINKKEIDFVFRINNQNINLSISANPNSPFMYIKESLDNNDKTPTGFVMLLRKYLKSGKIIDIKQIRDIDTASLERIVDISIYNINDKGDYDTYHLIVELMGKYSNIILLDKNYTIIDVLNKPSEILEGARILMPKTKYTTNKIIDKIDIFNDDSIKDINTLYDYLINKINSLKKSKKEYNLIDAFSSSFSGLSKSYLAYKFNENDIDGYIDIYNQDIIKYDDFNKIINSIYKDIVNIDKIENKSYIFKSCNKYKDFHIFDFSKYNTDYEKLVYDSSSDCIIDFYDSRIKESQTSNNKKLLLNFVNNTKSKLLKKKDMYEKELKSSTDYEKYKVYGELINSFGHDKNNIVDNSLVCTNYYDNKEVKIPLDLDKSISENANHYYNKYNKLKRTITTTHELILKNEADLEHIDNILNTLNYNQDINDLSLIKQELNIYFKYNDKKTDLKQNRFKNSKFNYNIDHYKSSSGIDIYVGKNNLQNEYLTFNIASPNDTWLHVKQNTGSHVIIKGSYENIDMKTIEEAASLAAYFSTMKNENKVTVDYTYKKELKKVKGKPPGFVIYHKNYSINVTPGIFIKKI